MKRDTALKICGVTKHQYYYQSNGRKQGVRPSKTTKRVQKSNIEIVCNKEVVDEIKFTHQDPDTDTRWTIYD